MADQIGEAVDPVVSGWIDKIHGLVEHSETLEQVRDGLMDLYPEMNLEQYAEAMREALTAAELAGRADIVDQARGG